MPSAAASNQTTLWYDAFSDGGCIDNGRIGATAYGSFLVRERSTGKVLHHANRFSILAPKGKATNNLAEAVALHSLLKYLATDLKVKDPTKKVEVLIHVDSELIHNQVRGIYQVKNPDLRATYAAMKNELQSKVCEGRVLWDVVKITWISGEVMKEILGH